VSVDLKARPDGAQKRDRGGYATNLADVQALIAPPIPEAAAGRRPRKPLGRELVNALSMFCG